MKRDLDTARQWGREILKTHELQEFTSSSENAIVPVIDTTQLQADAQPRKMSISGIMNTAIQAGIVAPGGGGSSASGIAAGSGVYITQSGDLQVINNSIYSVGDLSDVDTTTVAPSGGQALVWDNTAQKWEPGTVSGGGTTLPSGQDGEALIYENGQWVTGPVIGGVNYTSGVTTLYTVPTGFSSWSDTWTFGSGVTNITLSNSDRTATATGFGLYPAYSVSAKSTGKWYWEIRVGGTTDYVVGLVVNPSQFPGAGGTGGIGVMANGTIFNDSGATVATFSGFSANDVLMFALDADAKKLWIGVNGTWDNSGDPAAGTGAIANSWTATPDWLFASRMYSSGMTATIENYGGTQITIPYSIDKLVDVDTSTVAPTDGQVLVWDNTAQKWEPGAAGASTAQATAITLLFS